MWKNQPSKPASAPTPPPAERSLSPRSSRSEAPPATIGRSISVKGDIRGEGDLLIEGRVTGGIELKQHEVTIGRHGRVEADVRARRICIEGEIKGNLFGEEVVVRESGRVEGDATAPKVTLETGCQFRGKISMQPEGEAKDSRPAGGPKPASQASAARTA